MRNIPKIVRERLKVAMPVARHPDADVLTAFAERSLPQLERAAVIEHLARCGDCRDVIALALPASEDLQKVFVPARAWLTWPALRWGFVTAGVIAIAAVGFLQVQRRQTLTEKKEVALFEAPASPPHTQTAPASAVAPVENRDKSVATPPSSADLVSRNAAQPGAVQLVAPSRSPQVSAPGPMGIAGVAAGAAAAPSHTQFPHGPMPPTQWQQQTVQVQGTPAMTPSPAAKQQAAAIPANRIPSASETVEVEASASLNVRPETSNQDSRLQVQSAESEEGAGLGGAIGKAKPVVDVEAGAPAQQTPAATVPQQLPAAAANVAMDGRNFTQLTPLAQAQVPRWTIGPAGLLQRSFDQGKTWLDVDVSASQNAASAVAAATYTTAEVLPKNARVQEFPADKKVVKAPPILFRALAVNGTDVWAGGFNAALYHSADAGSHWTQVVPSSAGATLSGDIISLEFSDTQHGKVTTSAAQVWVTADGGQTWQKQ